MNFSKIIPDTAPPSYLGVNDTIEYLYPDDITAEKKFESFTEHLEKLFKEYLTKLKEGESIPQDLYVELPFVTDYSSFYGNIVGLIAIRIYHSMQGSDIFFDVGFCRIFHLEDNRIIKEGTRLDSSWNHHYTPKQIIFLGENNVRQNTKNYIHQFALFQTIRFPPNASLDEIRDSSQRAFRLCHDRLQLIPLKHSKTVKFPPPFLSTIF